jgi:hypothetical protein
MARARVTFNAGSFTREVEARVTDAMRATALHGEAVARSDALNQPGQGKLYPRGKSAVHRASAPGQPPAPDTGRMRASVTSETVKTAEGIAGRASVNTDYALALDLGTERVAPRPFRQRILDSMFAFARARLRRVL